MKDRGDFKEKNYNSKFCSSWEKKDTSAGAPNAIVKGDEKNGEGFKGRRLSQAELEDMTKKGLCFKCGES